MTNFFMACEERSLGMIITILGGRSNILVVWNRSVLALAENLIARVQYQQNHPLIWLSHGTFRWFATLEAFHWNRVYTWDKLDTIKTGTPVHLISSYMLGPIGIVRDAIWLIPKRDLQRVSGIASLATFTFASIAIWYGTAMCRKSISLQLAAITKLTMYQTYPNENSF